MPLTVKSLDDLNRDILKNLHRLDRNAFDAVVGIPRSGMTPASMIALHLQKPLADLNAFCAGAVSDFSDRGLEKPVSAILLVDDSCNKGGAMRRAKEKIRRAHRNVKIFTLAIYGPYQVEEKLVDIWFEWCQGPRAFEWNLMKHKRNERWAYDIDGVLCRDPTNEENDDGARYVKFLEAAPPLLIPKRPVHTIITSRIEKYRPQTERWLHRQGVQYGKLVMLQAASKAERMQLMKSNGGRGGWKARELERTDCELYIESSRKQASIIAKLTGRPVWCVETRSLHLKEVAS